MNIGILDEKIKIYKTVEKENELGSDSPAESLVTEVWAKVEPRTGSLLSGRPADTKLSKTTHAITVRSSVARYVTYDCVIVWDDINGIRHRMEIDYILPPTRNSVTTTIYAQEIV